MEENNENRQKRWVIYLSQLMFRDRLLPEMTLDEYFEHRLYLYMKSIERFKKTPFSSHICDKCEAIIPHGSHCTCSLSRIIG